MYLYFILQDIKRGAYQDIRLEQLPSGLEEYYQYHWDRMVAANDLLWRTKINIAYILATAEFAVSRRLIAECTDVDAVTVQKVLNEWEQFLHRHPGPEPLYSIYHTSFRDFLHRDKTVQSASIDIAESYGKITAYLLKEAGLQID